MAGGDDVTLSVGDLVRLVDMPDPAMNGETAKLVKPVGKDRWVVVLIDGNEEKSKVVTRKCLQKLEQQQGLEDGRVPPPASYSITGSWDDWDIHEMRWNADEQCFEYPVVLGKGGKESFKLLLGGDWDTCLHPNKQDANPHDGHTLQGPDDGGLDEAWTIGLHPADKASSGAGYQVRLSMTRDGKPRSVAWSPNAPPPRADPAPARAATAGGAPAGADSPGAFPAIRPHAPWSGATGAAQRAAEEAAAMDAESMERAEREARERLTRRLAAAAEAETLAIEDGSGRTAGSQAADWESKMRQRRLKDARSRFEERYTPEGQPAETPAAAEATAAQPQERPFPAEEPPVGKCIDCGGETPYKRCSSCVLRLVHKSSWRGVGSSGKAAAPAARLPQPVPEDPRDAFDHFWTFSK